MKLYRTTFDELISTGQLTLISSDSLRSKILFYYEELQKTQKDIFNNSDNLFYKEVFPTISSLSDLGYPKDIGSVLVEKFKNPEEQFRLAKAIIINQVIFDIYQNALKDAYMEVEDTIQLIESERNK